MSPNILSYLDYRTFLKDWFEQAKDSNSFYSYRYIGQKTGLDPSFLVKVLAGQLHISQKSIPAITKLIKLDKREEEYFSVLVAFNKTKKNIEAEVLFKKLIALQGPQAHILQAHEHAFFQNWYNIVIYELLRYYDFKEDYRALSRKVSPPVTVSQAKDAVDLLLKLGLIQRADSGQYIVKDKTLSTGEKWMSGVIRAFQKQAIELAARALDEIPAAERDISTVTISLSSATYSAICQRIKEMRHELLEMARNDTDLDGVYQINFQIYPVVKKERADD